MSSADIQTALWVFQPLVQGSIAYIMYRRKLHLSFPIFFAFALVQVGVFAIEFPVYHWGNRDAYFYVFWSVMAVNLIIEFKVIHEVFLDIFRPYPALKDLGTALFKWAALIMILISVVLISVSPAWDDPLAKTGMVAHRCVRVIQCGMVLFLLAFSKPLGLSWRRQSFGISVGFGFLAAIELLTNALFSGTHISSDLLNIVDMGTYNMAAGLWLAYSWANSRDVRGPVLVPQRWDEALTELHRRDGEDSLIPMFEHMVDRAFSKTQSHA